MMSFNRNKQCFFFFQNVKLGFEPATSGLSECRAADRQATAAAASEEMKGSVLLLGRM